MGKNEILAALPTVLGRHDVCNIESFLKNNQRSAMCRRPQWDWGITLMLCVETLLVTVSGNNLLFLKS